MNNIDEVYDRIRDERDEMAYKKYMEKQNENI